MKRYLIYNENFWKLERQVHKDSAFRIFYPYFGWSDEEIERGKQNEDGIIGEKYGYVCIVTKIVGVRAIKS